VRIGHEIAAGETPRFEVGGPHRNERDPILAS
jgi:hypothetical protein